MMQTLVRCPNCGLAWISYNEDKTECHCYNCGEDFPYPGDVFDST